MEKRKFWVFQRGDPEKGETVLRLDGPIAKESWFGDEVTPALFLSELERHPGDLTVWINSPGGDVFAASQIYTMLMDHQGKITVKVEGLAASAASVIAMAGGEVLMSPSSMMMIHNPTTIAEGWKDEMERAVNILEEVKASIINAYELKTGLSRHKISQLMDDETWMNARKAKELGFCDGFLFTGEESEPEEGMVYAARKMVAQVLNKIGPDAVFKKEAEDTKPAEKTDIQEQSETGTRYTELEKRLELLRH
ncbi:MAG: head maturation protease, ClpP-related [Aliarcobacter sp.]|jgi:ATP-dependent Clp protease protease subunit